MLKVETTYGTINQLELNIIANHQIIYITIEFTVVKKDLSNNISSFDETKRFFQWTDDT